jgi:hypothetical protein
MKRKSSAIQNSLPSLKRGGNAISPPISGGVTQSLVNNLVYGMGFIIISLFALVYYLTYLYVKHPVNSEVITTTSSNSQTFGLPNLYLPSLSTRRDPYSDPYAPPLKNDGFYFPSDSSDIRGIPSTCNSGNCGGLINTNTSSGLPINVSTRGYSSDFTQIGLLTRERRERSKTGDTAFTDNMILPLFGRRVLNGRGKYQYYTMSNTGAVNTKLPVRIKGKNCINEYGCDELMNGDSVMVEGYNEKFSATVYENGSFSYIPYL